VAEEYAKAIIKGTQDQFTSENPYFGSIKAFFEQMRPEVYFVEVVLVNTKEVYAGTCDLIAKLGNKLFVIDWKTSKAVYDEYPLQVEAYRRCDMMILENGDRLTEQPQMAESGGVVLL